MKKLFLIMLIAIAVAISAFAVPSTVPSTITYQGRLLSSGSVVNGNVTMRFALYDAASGGTKVWPQAASYEEQIINIDNGLYTAYLGNTYPFSSALFNTNLYLEVTVDGTTLTPRTQLMTTPYSYYSGIAKTVDDGAISTSKLADDAVTSAKILNGTIVDDDVSATAAIAGSKIVPTFGAQTISGTNGITITGTVSLPNNAITDAMVVDALTISGGTVNNTIIGGTTPAAATFTNITATGTVSLPNGEIGTSELADASVTAVKIATDAVTTVKILDGNVTTAKIAADAVTSAKIADGTIVNADISGTAAIAGSKISPDFVAQNVTTTGNISTTGTGTITSAGLLTASNGLTVSSGIIAVPTSIEFEGSTADAFETTLTVTNPTADRTITLPNASGTVLLNGDIGVTVQGYNANTTTLGSDISLTTEVTGTLPIANGGTGATTAAGARTNLGLVIGTDVQAYNVNTSLLGQTIGTSEIEDNAVTTAKILDGTITNADISASAAIADTKLATISTAGKVANSATTATSANTNSAIVARDASGNFSAGTITAALTGNASTATTLATGRNFSLTGDVTATAVSFNGSANVALATTLGDNTVTSAKITDATIVNADISASAAIADTKLATISTAGKVSNSATTATSANTNSAIVARDASGNFSAGTITAALSGNATTATNLSAGGANNVYLGGASSNSWGLIGSANITDGAIAGTDLASNISISTTGNIATTGTGTITSAGGFVGNVTGNVSGTAANVTGIVAIANGGTGAATVAGAKTALGLATVATTGSFFDLLNLPNEYPPLAHNQDWSTITATPTTVAGYGITDAMTTAHAANVITSTNIANWNTAYGWGDHSTEGYLKSYTETDGVIGNEVTNATDATLTRSGLGTSVSPYTLGLNLGNENTWTATQTFSSVVSPNYRTSTGTASSMVIGEHLNTAYMNVWDANNAVFEMGRSGGVNGTATQEYGIKINERTGGTTRAGIGHDGTSWVAGVGALASGTGVKLNYAGETANETRILIANAGTPTFSVDREGDVVASTVSATTFTGALTGNASTATKLAATKDFSLTGDVSATAIAFDGSGNVALSTTIGTGKVTNDMLAGSIVDTKLNQITTASKVAISAIAPGTNGQLLSVAAGVPAWVDAPADEVNMTTTNAVPKWNGTQLVDGPLVYNTVDDKLTLTNNHFIVTGTVDGGANLPRIEAPYLSTPNYMNATAGIGGIRMGENANSGWLMIQEGNKEVVNIGETADAGKYGIQINDNTEAFRAGIGWNAAADIWGVGVGNGTTNGVYMSYDEANAANATRIMISNGNPFTPTFSVDREGDVSANSLTSANGLTVSIGTVSLPAGEIGTTELADDAVTSVKIFDGTIVNDDISGTAAIAGSKITPNFVAQNVSTTGTLAAGATTLSSTLQFGTGTAVSSIVTDLTTADNTQLPTALAVKNAITGATLSEGNGIDLALGVISVDLDGTSLSNDANGLSLNVANPNTWTGKQSFSTTGGPAYDVLYNGNIIIHAGAGHNNEGYLKTRNSAGNSTLVTLGSTLAGERGAVSVGHGNTNTAADWKASMVYLDGTEFGLTGTPLADKWMVGTGELTAQKGAAMLYNTASGASLNIFNGNFTAPTFSVEADGDLKANELMLNSGKFRVAEDVNDIPWVNVLKGNNKVMEIGLGTSNGSLTNDAGYGININDDNGNFRTGMGYNQGAWVAGVVGAAGYQAGAITSGGSDAMLAVFGGSETPVFTANQAGAVTATSVTATTFTGALTGNASTATKLAATKDFSLTGDVSATAIAFDGSGNVALSTTIGSGKVTNDMLAGSIAQSKITDLTTDLSAIENDITALENEDVTLQANIDAEETARIAGDDANATAIALKANAANPVFTGSLTAPEIRTSTGTASSMVIGEYLNTAYMNVWDANNAVFEMGRSGGVNGTATQEYGIKINERTGGATRAGIGHDGTSWVAGVGALATGTGVKLNYAGETANETRILIANANTPTFTVDREGDVTAKSATLNNLTVSGDGATVTLPNGVITNDMLAGSIADTKLATISTVGKVANSATTATSTNTPSAIVARDANGDFSAGAITASSLSSTSGLSVSSGTVSLPTGSITSTHILDGTILDADINASAAIAGSKISPDFATQNITTSGSISTTGTGTITSAGLLTASNGLTVSSGSVSLPTGSITDASVTDALTISGGTINNSIIGGTAPAAATFTDLTASGTISLPLNSINSTNILNLTIVNDDINAEAGIAGTKINPSFGAQGISTTGSLSAGAGTLTSLVISDGLNVTGGTVSLPSGQIGADELASDAVTAIKIAADAVTAVKINADVAGSGLRQNVSGALEFDPTDANTWTATQTFEDVVVNGDLTIGNGGSITATYLKLPFSSVDESNATTLFTITNESTANGSAASFTNKYTGVSPAVSAVNIATELNTNTALNISKGRLNLADGNVNVADGNISITNASVFGQSALLITQNDANYGLEITNNAATENASLIFAVSAGELGEAGTFYNSNISNPSSVLYVGTEGTGFGLEIVSGGASIAGGLTVTSGTVSLPAGQIGETELANDAVTAAKINADVAGVALISNGTTGALDVNYNTSLIAVTDLLGINFANENNWTATQTFEDVIINGSSTFTNAITGVTPTDAMHLATKQYVDNALSFSEGITFEGITIDNFETTISVVDPTADNSITLPNASGTILLNSNIGSTVQGYNANTSFLGQEIDLSTSEATGVLPVAKGGTGATDLNTLKTALGFHAVATSGSYNDLSDKPNLDFLEDYLEVDGIIGNEITNATDGTLTRSGTGTDLDPYTLGLNLENTNTWTGKQTFANVDVTGNLLPTGAGKITATDLSLPISETDNIGGNLFALANTSTSTGTVATFTSALTTDDEVLSDYPAVAITTAVATNTALELTKGRLYVEDGNITLVDGGISVTNEKEQNSMTIVQNFIGPKYGLELTNTTSEAETEENQNGALLFAYSQGKYGESGVFYNTNEVNASAALLVGTAGTGLGLDVSSGGASIAGGIKYDVSTATSGDISARIETIIQVNNDVTELPNPASYNGRVLYIVNVHATNTINVSSASRLAVNSTDIPLGQAITLISNGTKWYIINYQVPN